MNSARIAGISIPVTRLIFGTAHLAGRVPLPTATRFARRQAAVLLDAAYEAGYRAFDTAGIWQLGGRESVLGEWLAVNGVRQHVVIVGKGAHPSLLGFRSRMHERAITADLEQSLRRLRTDYLDLFLLHRDDPEVPVPTLLEILHHHQASGRVRAYGGSNWTHQRLSQALYGAENSGLTPFAASSPQYGIAVWRQPPWPGCVSISGPAAAAARSWYQETHLPVLAWSPLAGILAGGNALSPGRRGPYATAANARRRERLMRMAVSKSATPAQLALAYVLNSQMNAFAVVSTATPQRLRENRAATDLALTSRERNWLNLSADVEIP